MYDRSVSGNCLIGRTGVSFLLCLGCLLWKEDLILFRNILNAQGKNSINPKQAKKVKYINYYGDRHTNLSD